LPPLVEGIPQSWLYQGLACQQVTVYDIIMVLKEVVDFYRDGFSCLPAKIVRNLCADGNRVGFAEMSNLG
jgi:hypothetical protein